MTKHAYSPCRGGPHERLKGESFSLQKLCVHVFKTKISDVSSFVRAIVSNSISTLLGIFGSSHTVGATYGDND